MPGDQKLQLGKAVLPAAMDAVDKQALLDELQRARSLAERIRQRFLMGKGGAAAHTTEDASRVIAALSQAEKIVNRQRT